MRSLTTSSTRRHQPSAMNSALQLRAAANGWYTGDVSSTWTVTELESPNSLDTTGCDDQNVVADQVEREYSCSATSAGGSAGPVNVSIKRDATAPVVSYGRVTAGTEGLNGWYTSDVTAEFTATDATSGLAADASAPATSSGEGSEVSVLSPALSDLAGNTTDVGEVSASFKIDKTAPSKPTFIGGPASSYYFGNDPALPTCASTDAVSGIESCVVTGDGTSVGAHTYTATATDHAGNTSTSALGYTVLAWRVTGFYSPVDMGDVLNTVKGGVLCR